MVGLLTAQFQGVTLTRLYHFTNKQQLASILSAGELFMTPNPYIKDPVTPVLWLTDRSGEDLGGDGIAFGLNLTSVTRDLVSIRFTVEVPDDEVVSWSDYASFYGIDKYTQRKLDTWPSRSGWWVPFMRSIKSDEWVDIGVGRGVWEPMFYPENELNEVQV